MRLDIFYVLDVKNDSYKKFNSYYSLLCYVHTKPLGYFGNHNKDKRWQSDRWSCWSSRTSHVTTPTFGSIFYVAYDEFMNIVPCSQLDKDVANKSNFVCKYKHWKRYIHENYLGFRNGPVPYTGVRHRKYSSYYRNVRTTQELIMNIPHIEYTRGKRRNLPTSYDDIRCSDKFIKFSWKKQKKARQWM